MTQEDKQLIYKDLCARLPYKLIGLYYLECRPLEPISFSELTYKLLHRFVNSDKVSYLESIIQIKPYLRPMSNMTKEELKELINLHLTKTYPYRRDFVIKEIEYVLDSCWCVQITYKDNGKECTSILYVGRGSSIEEIDWLNANHFDYRGLIPMRLALPAQEGMYNFK